MATPIHSLLTLHWFLGPHYSLNIQPPKVLFIRCPCPRLLGITQGDVPNPALHILHCSSLLHQP